MTSLVVVGRLENNKMKNRVSLNLTDMLNSLLSEKRISADIFREKEIEVHKIDVKVYCHRKKEL